jgi:molybdenum cofactor synthesis domain-containing protein
MTPSPTASILIIGNEILSGRTQDKNLHWLAGQLTARGIKVKRVEIVPDVEADIIEAVNRLRGGYAMVFTSGGIGPTHDDITSASMAKAFGVALERHPEAVRVLKEYYTSKGEALTEARLKMAEIPVGAQLIDNSISAAPGFQLKNVYVLAGVPSVFQAMVHSLQQRLVGGKPILSQTIKAMIAESKIAAFLGDLQTEYPELEIGSYPFNHEAIVGTRLVFSGTEPEQIQTAQQKLHTHLQALAVEFQLDDAS